MIHKLPNKRKAVVEDKKIRDYLLCLEHPVGGGKAIFFISHGFNRNYPGQFRSVLLEHARTNPVIKVETTEYVTKYIIEGPVRFTKEKVLLVSYTEGPNPRKMQEVGFEVAEISIVTVWGIEPNTKIPKLVTAYPM